MRTKNILKSLIAITFISTLFFSCTDNIDLIDNHKHISLKKINLKEIPGIQKKIPKYFNKKFRNNNKNLNTAIFDFENILEAIDTLNNINYSFHFIIPESNEGVFYNLIISKNEIGEFQTPYVLKYKCNQANLSNFLNNNLDMSFFVGEISLHKYTDYFELNYFDKDGNTNCPPEFDENGDPIPCEVQTENSSGNGSGGDSGYSGENPSNNNEDASGSSGSVSWTVSECWCEGQLVGGYHQCSTYLTITIMEFKNLKSGNDCPPCTPASEGSVAVNTSSNYSTAKRMLKNTLSLNNQQLDWVANSNNSAGVIEIYNFLQDNGFEGNYSQDAQNFANELISISMSEEPAIDINQIMDIAIISPDLSKCNHNLITRSFITKSFLEDTAFGEKIKNTFILNPNTHISFKPVTNQNNTTTAKTNYVRVPITINNIIGNAVTIEFNINYLNQANDIAIVTTIFHELLHAYIVELYYSGTLLDICPEYTELNDAFNAFVNDSNYPNNTAQINQTIIDNLDNEMHDIYEDYIEDLAESIHTYAIKNNFKINNNVISLDYARNLAWGSLQTEDVFSNCPTQIQASQTFNNCVLNNLNNSDNTPTKSCDN